MDPIFAITIGLGAAATRIKREEQEKGHSLEETWEAGKRRLRYTLGLDGHDKTLEETMKQAK